MSTIQVTDTEALRELDRPTPDPQRAAGPTPAPVDGPDDTRLARRPQRAPETPKNLYDRIEAFISRLSVRDNFWHSICSLIWLPLAFFSGIRMKQLDPN